MQPRKLVERYPNVFWNMSKKAQTSVMCNRNIKDFFWLKIVKAAKNKALLPADCGFHTNLRWKIATDIEGASAQIKKCLSNLHVNHQNYKKKLFPLFTTNKSTQTNVYIYLYLSHLIGPKYCIFCRNKV